MRCATASRRRSCYRQATIVGESVEVGHSGRHKALWLVVEGRAQQDVHHRSVVGHDTLIASLRHVVQVGDGHILAAIEVERVDTVCLHLHVVNALQRLDIIERAVIGRRLVGERRPHLLLIVLGESVDQFLRLSLKLEDVVRIEQVRGERHLIERHRCLGVISDEREACRSNEAAVSLIGLHVHV